MNKVVRGKTCVLKVLNEKGKDKFCFVSFIIWLSKNELNSTLGVLGIYDDDTCRDMRY